MPGSLTIKRARLVLPDRVATGDLVVEDGIITAVGPSVERTAGEVIDGAGLVCMPGAIDAHVHFREPGLTHNEDLASGSRACAAGGITGFLEMPNTDPLTTTVAALHDKLALASSKSVVHYGFFIGATSDNVAELVAAERTCGIKVSMGSSTDPRWVDSQEALEEIFSAADKLVAVHAEDETRLKARYAARADATDVALHPEIRDEETALIATKRAIALSQRHGTRLHVLHVSSAAEAELLSTTPRDRISAEVCPQHLFLDETAYARIGTRAQCDPPVRARRHREALWRHLLAGTFDCIATDHAPHTVEEKARPFPTAPSGMPGVEWALPLMLHQVHLGRITLQQVVRWMCDGPARTYAIPRKGRLEVGYDGDLVLVDTAATRTVEDGHTHTRCGWSPYAGWTITGWPVLTAVLGRPVFRDGQIVSGVLGRELTYQRREP
jgi:dihydroorotase